MDNVIISQEVWADEKGKPVPYGDSRGRTVLFGQGQQITGEDAKKYHISEDGRFAEPVIKAVDAAPSNKAINEAPRTK